MGQELLNRYPNQGFYSVYDYDDEKGCWIGLVVERKDDDLITHTVGCEATKKDIQVWCDDALKAISTGQPEPPDMYDRKKLN